MGYLHIENLYRPKAQRLLEFKEVYVLEKIHGTSTHISIKENGEVYCFSGGCNNLMFQNIFGTELPSLADIKNQVMQKFGSIKSFTIFGEGYGGKTQGMSKTYGDKLRFVAFDVQINGKWLSVHDAANICESLSIPFVWWTKCSSDLETLNKYRDQESQQAIRNGVGAGKKSEGIVIRPPFEVTLNDGERLIAKHKTAEFSERKTKEVDPKKLVYLTNAESVAEEWVTEMRLTHVLDRLSANGINCVGFEEIKHVINAMIEDVLREGQGEFEVNEYTSKAISKKTVALYKKHMNLC